MNTEHMKAIVYWVLTGLVGVVFAGSALGKIIQNADTLRQAGFFGLDANTYLLLGLVELACLVLFIIPRTGIIGTFLLAAYMGGAIATHLEHGLSIIAPCVIESAVLLVAFYRFPSLRIITLNTRS